MRRKVKTQVKAYYIISIICLVVLFAGYGFIFNLSEKSKEGKDVKTISLVAEDEKITEKYNKLFAKFMSYFNIFFKETFEEYDDNGLFDDHYDDKLYGSLTSVESGTITSLDNIDLCLNSDYSMDEYCKSTVLVSSNLKENFFTVVGGYDIASRLGITPKQFKQDVSTVNQNYKVIVYHTHATEAYNDKSDTNFRTNNNNENVVKIGSIISDNLNNNGIAVTHLKEQNDYPSYNKSYSNSKQLVLANMVSDKKNIIIDVHRDGADAESNYEKILESVARVKMNDRTIATFSIIVGGRNENKDKLVEFANLIKSVSDELYPGLCRGVVVRDGGCFNQNLSDYALLLEVGCHLNTFEESEKTSFYLSEILCKSFLKLD